MNKIENIVETFYRAFAKRDFQTMNKFYHKEAQFSDPVFQRLQSLEAQAMWHMLCEAGKDLQITYGSIGVFDNSAQVKWKAVYTFSKTGNIIHNEVKTELFFKDNLIINHFDSFSLYRWIRMAFGVAGGLFGWSNIFQDKVKGNARYQLKKFIDQHPLYR
jgi:SnoaL-like domain